ncbi:MerR family transcriptional regulator [Plantactinospora siamensis]|uniref:MerR family transcriptional regulator n=1 Tax=Plantactinospora siamensis TaxID=555372 RepID=A0ABV6P2W5_9ACTN
MDHEPWYSIGELARRTGLTVKAIRFYADRGIVPPTGRDRNGHRRYDGAAAARLDLVRTLRELGLDLAGVRAVVDREAPLAEVAATHADALAAQIRVLRVRHAALTVLANRRATTEELELMRDLAGFAAEERRRLVDGFLDAVFDGLTPAAEFAGIRQSMTPYLPAEPTAEQLEAWAELIALAQDPEFRAGLRRLARLHAADRAGTDGVVRRDAVATARDQVAPALASGVEPTSPAAERVVTAVLARYGHDLGRPVDPALRRRLRDRLESVADPRRERYLRLLCVVNGWPVGDDVTPAVRWLRRALGARTAA